jgi:branched-chain amino acid transport system substrate-binding protein
MWTPSPSADVGGHAGQRLDPGPRRRPPPDRRLQHGHTIADIEVCEQRQRPASSIDVAAAPPLTEQGYQVSSCAISRPARQLVANGLRLINDLLAADQRSEPKTRRLPARQRHVRAPPKRGAMDALFPRANLPFELVETIAYDPARAGPVGRGHQDPRAAVPTSSSSSPARPTRIKLVRDMVRQRFEPDGHPVSPGSPRPATTRSSTRPSGRLARTIAIYERCPGPIPQRGDDARPSRPPSPRPNRANRSAADGFNAGFTFEALLIAANAHQSRPASTERPATLMAAVRATDLAEHVIDRRTDPARRQGPEPRHRARPACRTRTARRPSSCRPSDAATAKPVLPDARLAGAALTGAICARPRRHALRPATSTVAVQGLLSRASSTA